MMKACEGTSKLERKTVEKNRRLHMKSLCFKLSSLIPKDTSIQKCSSQDGSTQQDHLEEATTYIKKLQGRVEELKRKKQDGSNNTNSCAIKNLKLPIIEIRELEHSTLEILLVCGLNKGFVFYDAIIVVQEEGAEVLNASSSIVGDKIIYTIHSHITLPRIGLEASRVYERLKRLVQ